MEKVPARKRGVSQDKALPPTHPHPRFLLNFLPRYLARLISPPLPGGLNIIRARGQRFEKGGIAVEKITAREGGGGSDSGRGFGSKTLGERSNEGAR